jgi:hypothetical protein
MRILCTLSLSALLSTPLALLAGGCGGDDDDHDHDEVTNEDIIRLDDASEEVMLTLQDLVERGEVTVDDDIAAQLTAPEDGAELAADTPPTFTWAPRAATARHGITTGEFVWLHIAGPGMEAPIDVVSLEATSWEVDQESWDTMLGSTGPCEVQVVSAYVERGIPDEVFVPSTNPSFSVTE